MVVAVASTSWNRQSLLMLERDYSRTAPIWKLRIAAHDSCVVPTWSRASIAVPDARGVERPRRVGRTTATRSSVPVSVETNPDWL